MSRRVLFFPSYRGGGFGHLSRCLALADELLRQGWQVAFVLGGAHADRLAAEGWTVFAPPSPPPTPLRRWSDALLRRLRPAPTYLFFSDLNFQVVRDGFHSPQTVDHQVQWELDVVRRFRPHLLVGDAWLLTSIVGRLADLPVVQIVRAAAHPACPNLVWWRPLPSQLQPPDIRPVFNPLLEQWKLPPIQRAEDLFDGTVLLVPSIPTLDPPPPDAQRTHYVGPLVRSTAQQHLPDGLDPLPRDRPLVYVTMGGGSAPRRGLDLMRLWETAFSGTGWQIVISTGGQPVPRRTPRAENFSVRSWLPGAALIERADAVLFHGGYGTMMETVRAGVPSVVLPSHTEQECNGRRLEQNGAAQVLAPGEEELFPHTGQWSGGTFVTLISNHLTVTPAQIHESVSRLLNNQDYRTSAEQLAREQGNYHGAAQAVELFHLL